ncbi:MAG: glutamine-hydrolyzing GMP synthase [Thermodesulfobacteriota bacterium]
MPEKVLVLDFGSQYTQLIARRIRENGVYSEIKSYDLKAVDIKNDIPNAIILSGGPASVWDNNSPALDIKILELDIPILAICYGMQTLVHQLGGKVEHSAKREFGPASLKISGNDPIFSSFTTSSNVWMSHGDRVIDIPSDFVSIAKTDNTPHAVIKSRGKNIYGTQFHPEVVHTEIGNKLIHNFLFKIAGMKGDWTPRSFIETTIQGVRDKVENSKVLCALSGGVDSSVTALLLNEAIGKNLYCVFVDTGMLRLNEAGEVTKVFEDFDLNFVCINAGERFLDKLHGVSDPERKRKIIGAEFIRVFEEEALKISDVKFLAQGTLYPDIIESVSVRGPSATIKSHHNVGGLPSKMNLEIVEPLKELFKDEVRKVGKELGLSPEMLGRHPFPGPGLGIRIMGEITKERLDILKYADTIFIEELRKAAIYDEIWQAFCVFLPVKTVGVMGDERTYENVCALRAVTSTDGMTANWYKIPYEILEKISVRIINEVKGINRVVYDISTKPPSTIEWE